MSTTPHYHPSIYLTVFDWDDTLCPSTWLSSFIPLRTNIHLIRNQLQRLNEWRHQLLEAAIDSGAVYIITAAKIEWIQRISTIYFPELSEFLACYKIPILSVYSFTNESRLTPHRIAELKCQLLQRLLCEVNYELLQSYPQQTVDVHLLCIGDSFEEKEAYCALTNSVLSLPTISPRSSKIDFESSLASISLDDTWISNFSLAPMLKALHSIIPHYISFVPKPTLEELELELELLYRCYSKIQNNTKSVDLVLTKKQLFPVLNKRHHMKCLQAYRPVASEACGRSNSCAARQLVQKT